MIWGTVKLPSFSGGTIIRHFGKCAEEFSCHVHTGSWNDTHPEFKNLGPYDTYEKAQIALIEYGMELLERDKAALEERRKYISKNAQKRILFEIGREEGLEKDREEGRVEGMEEVIKFIEQGHSIDEAKAILTERRAIKGS